MKAKTDIMSMNLERYQDIRKYLVTKESFISDSGKLQPFTPQFTSKMKSEIATR